jgi:hypothetical protein
MSVRDIAVPQAARELSTLPRIDYADAYLVDGVPVEARTPEQWARAIFDDAPAKVRHTLRRGWLILGLKLGPAGSERHANGWEIRRSTADHVLLGADSRIGMPAELLVKRQEDTLLFCTFVQRKNLLARAAWAVTEPGHPSVVRRVLEHAARRARRDGGG